jgi:intron-binding protein aquarius
MLGRRMTLLNEVSILARSLTLSDAFGETCENAGHFFLLHILAKWELFTSKIKHAQEQKNIELTGNTVAALFPFTSYFQQRSYAYTGIDRSNSNLFADCTFSSAMAIALSYFADLQKMFVELEETRPFELLRNGSDRGNYLLTKHSKIIAMTCTHAAIQRSHLVALKFQYDNLIMEEAAQILEIETFIPMLLQHADAESGNRLKRVILLGDHNFHRS